MRPGPALLLLILAPSVAAQAEPYMLHMQDYDYLPKVLEVPAGATVYAMNFGSSDPNVTAEPHTVTSSTDRSLFDVQNIKPTGEAYPFQAPATPGEYPFYCIYHGDAQGQGMAGTLVVIEAAAPSPSASPSPSPTPSTEARADSPVPWSALAVGALVLALALRRW